MRAVTLELVCERFLLAIGLLKLFLIAMFFASFAVIGSAPAQTQDAGNCNGSDLLEKLKLEDNSSYQAVLAEAAKIKNGSGNFWLIEKDGQQNSYLFGTMHMTDPAISTLSEEIKAAINKSNTVVIESTDALDPVAAQQAMGQLAHLTLLTGGKTLRDFIRDDLEAKLEAEVTARGLPMLLADRMQPWVVSTTISLPVCELVRKQSSKKVLDAEVAAYGQEQGKELRGLESIAEQLSAMAAIPHEVHVSSLHQILEVEGLAVDSIETMKNLYLRGEVGLVVPLMKHIAPESYAGEGATKFQEILVEQRNSLMVERVTPYLEQGATFVAVGALHLSGETGIVNQLEKRGYKLSRLD